MNRSPIYSDDRKSRVISLPNGRWVAQKFTSGPRDGKGQNRHKANGVQLPHVDPWQDIAPPTADRAVAITRINPQPGFR